VTNNEGKQNTWNNNMEEKVETMKKELDALKTTGAAANQNANVAAGEATPFHERKEFIIGNLGYDTSGPVLEQRARDAQQQASMPKPSHLRAVFAFGSTVRISWPAGTNIFERRREIRDLEILHPEMNKAAQESRGEVSRGDKKVWMDVRKTKQEMLPSRLVRKAGELIQAEVNKLSPESRQPVVVCPVGKIVLIGGSRAGATRYGRWRWEHGATRLLPNIDLDALAQAIEQ